MGEYITIFGFWVDSLGGLGCLNLSTLSTLSTLSSFVVDKCRNIRNPLGGSLGVALSWDITLPYVRGISHSHARIPVSYDDEPFTFSTGCGIRAYARAYMYIEGMQMGIISNSYRIHLHAQLTRV